MGEAEQSGVEIIPAPSNAAALWTARRWIAPGTAPTAWYIAFCFRAEHDADGRVVVFRPFQFIVHSDVHVHLSDILMGNLAHLQIYEDIAFQHHIVEHEVDEVVFRIRADMLLPGDEGEATPQFHHEITQVGDDARLQVALREAVVRLEAEKLRHHGRFQDFLFLRDGRAFRRQRRLHVVTLVILRGYIAVQCPHAPHLLGSRFQIPADGSFIPHTKGTVYVRPCQIWKPRFPNLIIRHYKIELAERPQITVAVPAPVFVRQFLSERLYQFLAVLGTFLPVSMIRLMSSTTCEKFVAIVLLNSIFLRLFCKGTISFLNPASISRENGRGYNM